MFITVHTLYNKLDNFRNLITFPAFVSESASANVRSLGIPTALIKSSEQHQC